MLRVPVIFGFVLVVVLSFVHRAEGQYTFIVFGPAAVSHSAAGPGGSGLLPPAGKLWVSQDSWTSPDKFDHLLGSAMLSGSGFLALKVTHNDERQSFVSSIGLVVCLGALKEVYDIYHPGQQASWKDLTADVVGAALGVLIARSL